VFDAQSTYAQCLTAAAVEVCARHKDCTHQSAEDGAEDEYCNRNDKCAQCFACEELLDSNSGNCPQKCSIFMDKIRATEPPTTTTTTSISTSTTPAPTTTPPQTTTTERPAEISYLAINCGGDSFQTGAKNGFANWTSDTEVRGLLVGPKSVVFEEKNRAVAGTIPLKQALKKM